MISALIQTASLRFGAARKTLRHRSEHVLDDGVKAHLSGQLFGRLETPRRMAKHSLNSAGVVATGIRGRRSLLVIIRKPRCWG